MGLDLNTQLISDTFDGLIKTNNGDILTNTPTALTDGRGNDSSIKLATAGNGIEITGNSLVTGSLTISVNLSAQQITGTTFVKVGGSSSEFLKADGSVDSNTYALNSNLDQEILNRASGDNALQVQITSNDADIATIISNLNQEITSRIDADANLQTQITSNDSDILALNTALSQEVIDRTNADNALQAQITSNDADIATLQSDLAQEVLNRTNADNALQAQITLNDGDIATLQSDLSQEAIDRANADTNLQNNINTEESARVAADQNLQNQITDNDADIAALQVTDSGLRADLDQEILDRIAGDNALQTQITSNDSDINTLNSELDQEVLDRIAGDSTLQSNINTVATNLINETAARISADNTLQSNIDTEETARISADANLQSQIDGNDTDIATLQSTKQDIIEKGQANGYASLDSGGKVPTSELPDSIFGQLQYEGTWDASTDTPTLADPTTVQGHYYVVSVAGTYLTIDYAVGDWIVSNGIEWQKVDNTDAVTSVFGRLGNIVANENDYNAFYPLISDLTSETSARESADTNLQTQITSNDADILALQNAVSSNDSDILTLQGDLSTEVTNRTNADANLQIQIDTLSGGAIQDLQDVTDQGNTTTNSIEALSFVKTGGTSSQFLKADGSIDSNTYITSATAPAIEDNAGTPVLATGITALELRTLLDVDQAGTDNSTPVTLNTTSYDYLSITGQEITLGAIDYDTDIINKPSVVTPNDSTITIAGGTSISVNSPNAFTLNQATAQTITINHGDTSTLNGAYGSDQSPVYTITGLTVDSNGHLTGVTQNLAPSGANDATITIAAGSGLSGGGNFTTNQASIETITLDVDATELANIIQGGTYISVSAVSLPPAYDTVLSIDYVGPTPPSPSQNTNAVGSYAVMCAPYGPGMSDPFLPTDSTVAGTNYLFCAIADNFATQVTPDPVPSGTWKIRSYYAYASQTFLAQRIA